MSSQNALIKTNYVVVRPISQYISVIAGGNLASALAHTPDIALNVSASRSSSRDVIDFSSCHDISSVFLSAFGTIKR